MSTLAAAAAEPDCNVGVEPVEVGEHPGPLRGRPAERVGAAGLKRVLRLEQRVRGPEPAGNRLAARERELDGARGRSGEAGRLRTLPPRRCAGRQHRSAYRLGGHGLTLLGPGDADQGSKATEYGSPPIPCGRMPHGSAAGGGAPAPTPAPTPSRPAAEGGGSGAGCEAPSPIPKSRSSSIGSSSGGPVAEAA